MSPVWFILSSFNQEICFFIFKKKLISILLQLKRKICKSGTLGVSHVLSKVDSYKTVIKKWLLKLVSVPNDNQQALIIERVFSPVYSNENWQANKSRVSSWKTANIITQVLTIHIQIAECPLFQHSFKSN